MVAIKRNLNFESGHIIVKGNKITHLKDGTEPTDAAINKSQMESIMKDHKKKQKV